MAYLDLSHIARRAIGARRPFAASLQHTHTMLLAAVLASMTIIGIAAAMMRLLY
jgi:hypothetical protein